MDGSLDSDHHIISSTPQATSWGAWVRSMVTDLIDTYNNFEHIIKSVKIKHWR